MNDAGPSSTGALNTHPYPPSPPRTKRSLGHRLDDRIIVIGEAELCGCGVDRELQRPLQGDDMAVSVKANGNLDPIGHDAMLRHHRERFSSADEALNVERQGVGRV